MSADLITDVEPHLFVDAHRFVVLHRLIARALDPAMTSLYYEDFEKDKSKQEGEVDYGTNCRLLESMMRPLNYYSQYLELT